MRASPRHRSRFALSKRLRSSAKERRSYSARRNAVAFEGTFGMVSAMVSGNIPRIRTELQVMFFDTDCAAVVHNIAYLRFIETARTLLAEKLGLGLVQMAESKKYPVVIRTEIDYRRAASLGDRLVVEGWLDRLERVRFWCAFRIVRPADQALIVECRQMLAIIEMPASKLLRLPEEWDKYRRANARYEAFSNRCA